MIARNSQSHPRQDNDAFWSKPAESVLRDLQASENGLKTDEVKRRLERYGPNIPVGGWRAGWWGLLLRQFTNPIVLMLIGASVLSFLLHDPTDAAIILGIVLVSGMLGFWQEYGAAHTVERLLETVELKTTLVRDGRASQVSVDEVVPGDVVLLSAGSSIPADSYLLASRDLFVNEAALTGETYPVEKQPGIVAADTPLARLTNVLFLGTHVVSGSGKAVAVRTGRATRFGAIFARLQKRPETDFEHGVRRFGNFLLQVTLVLLITIFAINAFLEKHVLNSFLFALALAVGLTPQLLPAIISVNLAKGARGMAKKNVIVKRLASIENFGSMNVLCSDKTGTLTEGKVKVQKAVDASGRENESVLFNAYLNATFQSGFSNPIDTAIRELPSIEVGGWRRIDEVPYDFIRKRISVLCTNGQDFRLITKGAVNNVMQICTNATDGDGKQVPIGEAAESIRRIHEQISSDGYPTLAVALREMPAPTAGIDRSDEKGLTFLGLLVLHDPLKEGVSDTIVTLERMGVCLKIITGDHHLVAGQVARAIGFDKPDVMTGADLQHLDDNALPVRAVDTDVFAEIEPNQKERIILALRKAGRVVGYIGDGINDVPALHAADVSVSFQTAVDVAKEAADIVLLEWDLAVLSDGVREGRRTFANTLKYVFMASSANFGNMFSMALASVFLPFLPLLPKQILLTNLLTDFPELTIATDRVDRELVDRPQRWNVGFIRRFMLVFGPVSSFFDLVTFSVLLMLGAGTAEFRTGWFMESVVSAAMVVLVVRTRRNPLLSRPSRPLLATTFIIAAAAVALPYTALAVPFGFVSIRPLFVALMAVIVAAYLLTAAILVRWFYKTIGFGVEP